MSDKTVSQKVFTIITIYPFWVFMVGGFMTFSFLLIAMGKLCGEMDTTWKEIFHNWFWITFVAPLE